MRSRSASAYTSPVLHAIADSVNPLLTIAVIAALVLDWRRSPRSAALAFTIAVFAGVISIYAIRFADRAFSIWRSFGTQYSTHAAYAAWAVVALAFRRPRWTAVLVAILVAYLALIVEQGFHAAGDVVTSTAIACAVTAPWQWWARSRSAATA